MFNQIMTIYQRETRRGSRGLAKKYGGERTLKICPPEKHKYTKKGRRVIEVRDR